MLNQLITAFHSLDLDPTAEELAEVLWLALQMRRAKPLMPLSQRLWLALQIRIGMLLKPLFQRLKNSQSMKPPPMPRPKADRQEEIQTDTATTDDSFLLYPGSPGKKTSSGLPFRTPAARMLPHALSLARALRPLKQRVASRTVYQINEAATIEWIAETQIWLPVLQGIPERRFEIALVIENSNSMEIWPPVIAEFRRLLENHGAFRNVQTWELKSEEGKVHLYAKTHATSARSRSCKELLDPTQRRLILVVSDGVSAAWYTGQITKLLEYWGQYHPVAILQMLPQRLWRGTGLSQGLRVNLRAMVANVANRQLGDDAAESWLKENIPKGIKVPVVTLETESLNYWAKLVMGKGENWVQGVIFEPSTVKLEREVTATSAPTLTATERVKRFNALASPLAQQLVGYLAAAPLTLEVMRLVQQVMLPESGQIHLAEVFLGGLLKREKVSWVKYDFHDGVREILLDARSVLEGIEVLKVVSKHIERRLGCALDFGAWLENPAGVEVKLDERSRPFARVAAKVLKRLGGNYCQLVERLEETRTGKPSVLPDEERKGQLFTFENVSVNRKGKVIERQFREARQVVIDLGKGVNLEMVYIPAGTFLMGAAPNEARADSEEYPQHQVTLKSFYMGKYPVTQAQWQAIMGNNPSYFKGEKRPVENVTWEDAKVFCDRLSQRTGQTFRLPSEAEWEYACRAGTTTPFYFGETITPDLVNYDGNYPYGEAPKGKYRKETTPVGSFRPNAFGLYDMHGNVWEWCEDVWHENYKGAPTDGSVWETGGDHSYRLLRGGSWSTLAVWCRAAHRYLLSPDYRYNRIGLRVVLCAVWTL
jgi:formylglycine-generating enzyme required for sulfatase activity